MSLITALWVWYIQELLIWLSCSRWGTETSHQLPKVTWNQSNQHSWVHLAELPASAPAKWTNTPSQHHCLPTWEASLPPHKMLDWVTLTQLACFFTLVQANFSNILLRKKLKTSKLKNHIHPATYLDSMNVLPYQPGFFFFFFSFIYFWLWWVFSLAAVSRDYSSCGAQTFHCGGFYCYRARTPGHSGFSSCGSRSFTSQAPEHRLNSQPGLFFKQIFESLPFPLL